jgi:5'-nucleotidase
MVHRPKILVSNDDGYFSPGISALVGALVDIADITVVAPEQDRSGASNSLTLDRPLMLKKSANGFFYVNGTPTDCVHLAVTGMLDVMPDMVVSGINLGANMGDDTVYSGTVAAATEGYLLGIPSIAFSLDSRSVENLPTAAMVARELVSRCLRLPFPEPVLLNVNVPDVRVADLRGTVTTRLGKRHKAESVIRMTTPRNEICYWIGAAGAAQDAGDGTDFFAVASHFASVTPLQIDLTHVRQLSDVSQWLKA